MCLSHNILLRRLPAEAVLLPEQAVKVDILPVKTPEEAIHREIFQMTPFITLEQEKVILPQLPGCEAGRWFPAFADITAKGNTKQKGIDEIIRHFGIRLEETMAFGDGGNDVSMLRHAAIGVAMGNAVDEVKEHANYITTSVDEDGIANALKHFSVPADTPITPSTLMSCSRNASSTPAV